MQQFFEEFVRLNDSDEAILAQEVDELQSLPGGPYGYRLRRIILINYWLYGQQIFEIPHGRLFLAGENASGKSTVLAAALPIAIEGSLRPDRIDTFGSQNKKVEYYVLGGEDSSTPFNVPKRTSYIALEFEWSDPHQPPIDTELQQKWLAGQREQTRFLTVGLCLYGSETASGKRITPVYFVITDGSRVGENENDIRLIYEASDKKPRARDQAALKQLLQGRGIVCEKQRDYEQLVSRYLFGFDNIEQFHDLIDLLLILRQPNLSSELKLTQVYETLRKSLARIPPDITRRVIGTINEIDNMQRLLAHLRGEQKVVMELHAEQQGLQWIEIKQATYDYIYAHTQVKSFRVQLKRHIQDVSDKEATLDKVVERFNAANLEQQSIIGSIEALRASGVEEFSQLLINAQERLNDARGREIRDGKRLTNVRDTLGRLKDKSNRLFREGKQAKERCEEHLQEMYEVAHEKAIWGLVATLLWNCLGEMQKIQIDQPSSLETLQELKTRIHIDPEQRLEWLKTLEKMHSQREKIEQEISRAASLEESRRQDVHTYLARFQQGQMDFQAVLREVDEVLATVTAEYNGFITQPYAAQALMITSASEAGEQSDEAFLDALMQQFEDVFHTYSRTIEDYVTDFSQAIASQGSQQNVLREQKAQKEQIKTDIDIIYKQKKAEPEFVPTHALHRTVARAKLAEHGIAAFPLYALIDFAPSIDRESEQAGQIECMLEDAGLLDALVVPIAYAATADAILRQEGLSDCRLLTSLEREQDMEEASRNVPTSLDLQCWLRLDPSTERLFNDHNDEWKEVIPTLLYMLSVILITEGYSISNNKTGENYVWDGRWQHGLLTGRASGRQACYLGKETRLRTRRLELEALEIRRIELDEEIQSLEEQIQQIEALVKDLAEQKETVKDLLIEKGAHNLLTDVKGSYNYLKHARKQYLRAREGTQTKRKQFQELTRQLEHASNGIHQFANNATILRDALEATRSLVGQVGIAQNNLEIFANKCSDYQETEGNIKREKSEEVEASEYYNESYNQYIQAEAALRELQRMESAEDADEDPRKRLQNLENRKGELAKEILTLTRERTTSQLNVDGAKKELAEIEEKLKSAEQEEESQRHHFLVQVKAYPVQQLVDVLPMIEQEQVLEAAQMLQAIPLYEDQLAKIDRNILDSEYQKVRNSINSKFMQKQADLSEYIPSIDLEGRITFMSEGKRNPYELLELISQRIRIQEDLLSVEEAKLFEGFLFQEMAETINTYLWRAETWVQNINAALSKMPLINENYEIEWKANKEHDPTKLGGHLAAYHSHLRKPPQALTDYEREQIASAFREEVTLMRHKQATETGMNFEEALRTIFDYRDWFRFEVYITPKGGHRLLLTPKLLGKRSGAEQLFALYVPLFAALNALYDGAHPGAPRLLALDEAFDKASVNNMQLIIEFLANQGFQWIMTGPQITTSGSSVPVSIRYLMVHERSSLFATAIPRVWQGYQRVETEEPPFSRVNGERSQG